MRVVDRRLAQVTFSVRRGQTLPGTTTASIKYLNMVGQRYVELGRGTGRSARPSHPARPSRWNAPRPALDLTQLFNGFQPLFEGLSPKDVNQLAGSIVQVLQGEGGTVDSLLQHIGSLTTTVAAKDKVIGEVITNLNTVLTTVNDREAGFNDLVVTLQQLVSGFAGDRKPLGEAIAAMGDLTTVTAGLFQDGRAPLKDDIKQLGRLSSNLAESAPPIENFLRKTPAKMRAVTRIASYGSWLNLYLCEAKVSGVKTEDGSAPPTGIPVSESRCQG